LIIGRSGTGKTSLCIVLIDGESAEGNFGPEPGSTRLISTTTVERGNVTYHIQYLLHYDYYIISHYVNKDIPILIPDYQLPVSNDNCA
jgi:GTPase SAR1 family protein